MRSCPKRTHGTSLPCSPAEISYPTSPCSRTDCSVGTLCVTANGCQTRARFTRVTLRTKVGECCGLGREIADQVFLLVVESIDALRAGLGDEEAVDADVDAAAEEREELVELTGGEAQGVG